MSKGRIISVKAEDLRIGDIFSTDSTQVTEIQLGRDNVYIEGVCHGYGKNAELPRDQVCHLWQGKRDHSMTITEARRIAGDWHMGQSSALYAFSSSGTLRQMEALEECAVALRAAPVQFDCSDLIRLVGFLNCAEERHSG